MKYEKPGVEVTTFNKDFFMCWSPGKTVDQSNVMAFLAEYGITPDDIQGNGIDAIQINTWAKVVICNANAKCRGQQYYWN